MQTTVKSDIKPFRMYGNLYFVGSSRVSVHIIKTEDGLVMIDTGWPDMFEQILDSMKELNLKPEDIRAIIHSHGHIDHFGCTHQFKKLSGAKTYISRIDNDIVNGKKDLSWTKESGYDEIPTFDCDVLIEDGDILHFGNTDIRCRLAPGHTQGTLAFFVNLDGEEGKIVAAMHGGTGLNTLTKSFLTRYGLPLEYRDIFRKSLHELKNEKVDLVMGNHPGQNDTEKKLQKVLSGESIIDTSEWERILVNVEKSLDDVIELNK